MTTLTLPDQSSLYYWDSGPSTDSPPSFSDKIWTCPTVVLLHGLGASCDSWALQIPALIAAGFRVLAPDTPGFGCSRTTRRYHSIAEMSRFLPVLLDHLKLEKVSLVGISMGGTQALQFAADDPMRVDRLVLVNTFARLNLRSPRVWPYYLSRLVLVYTRGLQAQAQAVAWRIFPHSNQEALRAELIRQILQAQPGVYRSAMRALARFNLEHRLTSISMPVLVITGADDSTVPPDVQQRLVRRLPYKQQVTIPQAGHAVSVEKPDEFNRILLNFLCASAQA